MYVCVRTGIFILHVREQKFILADTFHKLELNFLKT